MAMILSGPPAAKALTAELKERADALKKNGIHPCLAIVRVGSREDDLAYERGALKRCDTVGINAVVHELPGDVTDAALQAKIGALSHENAVHGILLFRPLPKALNDENARAAIAPEKDVDGITEGSVAGLYSGTGIGYAPCTASACIELLKHYDIPIAGKRAVVIGRSLVIGKPVSMLLLAENATVTICHSKSENLSDICKEADILIVASGKASMVGKDFVRPGQTVIDVGIHSDENGGLCGDVAFSDVEPVVAAISPVPGGVGSVTTAILAKHVIEAAERCCPQSEFSCSKGAL